MLEKSNNAAAIIAGSSGLIGNELTKQMLERDSLARIYALTRRSLPLFHPKLVELHHPQLQLSQWDDSQVRPEYGFICLGSTRKQAGSKRALEQVDYHLVCDVALQMRQLGVKYLAVVSSYGASARSLSHYLKCKGRMEASLASMGFERLIVMRPGPLKGLREPPRRDEVALQHLLKLCQPLMRGPLANIIPIEAADVAAAMQALLFSPDDNKCQYFNSVAIKERLNRLN